MDYPPNLYNSVFSRYYSGLGLPDQRQINVFKQYMRITDYAAHMPRLESILELGGGYSTVLLARIGEMRNCKVFSVDLSPGGTTHLIKDPVHLQHLKKHVTLLPGGTLSGKDFWAFWEKEEHTEIGGISAEAVLRQLPKFIHSEFGQRKWNKLEAVCGKPQAEIDTTDLFRSPKGMKFPQEIAKILSQPGDEFDYYKNRERNQPGVIDELFKTQSEFDVIFFDCGEFSGIPEWLKLKDRIRPGGLAVFHDIYFPKSFKNFIVCAAVAADKSWEIQYQDLSTPQGLMLAIKK